MAVSIRGGVDYQVSGPLVSGDFTIGKVGGKTAYVRGAGSLVGPDDGSARVGINVNRIGFLNLWAGNVTVTDRAAGVQTTAVYLGVPSVQGNTVSGTAFSVKTLSKAPFLAPVTVAWSVTDAG